MCLKKKNGFGSLFLGIKGRNRTMRRSGVSICNDPVLMVTLCDGLCRDNSSDSVMLVHVNNPAVSQLCSFITTHVLFSPLHLLLLYLILEMLQVRHYCIISATGWCWRLYRKHGYLFCSYHIGMTLL